MEGTRGASPTKNSAAHESPEQLLSVFRDAALSVTKLYKTSAAGLTKARADGYQECLEDLLVFLDKQNIGLGDGEGWQIRRWATERLDGKDAITQSVESEDEVEKNEPVSSPELHRSEGTPLSTNQNEPEMRTDSAPPAPVQSSDIAPPTPPAAPVHQIVVPSRDNFTFQSTMTYPQDTDLTMANLDLSDSRANAASSHHTSSRPFRSRNNKGQRSRNSNHLGRGAGSKRKLNIAEIFDLGSIGGKDVFGGNGGAKRSRHA